MILAWVVFPLALFAVATGCGLLVRVGVPSLPGALLPARKGGVDTDLAEGEVV